MSFAIVKITSKQVSDMILHFSWIVIHVSSNWSTSKQDIHSSKELDDILPFHPETATIIFEVPFMIIIDPLSHSLL